VVEHVSQRKHTTVPTEQPKEQPAEPDYDWSWAENDDDGWVPPAVDATRPSPARIYDYCLGGKDNFEVDREAAERCLQVVPDGRAVAQANRRFLRSAVTRMARAGIHQFLDLGTGIPTSPSVHQVARRVVPDARVVYVDHDPIVLAHSRALLDGTDGVTALLLDLREPSSVVGDPRLRATLALDQPVGLLLVGVLHFVETTLAPQVVRGYLERLAPGSQVAVSVASRDGAPSPVTRRLEEVYRQTATPLMFRTRAQTEELIDGLDLLDPGIVDVSQWDAPGAPPLGLRVYAGIAAKPAGPPPRRAG
jgi:S-adenosyl methyltransferase